MLSATSTAQEACECSSVRNTTHQQPGQTSPTKTSTDTTTSPPYLQTSEAVIAELQTDAEQGLDEREAKARLKQYGRNELRKAKPTPEWLKFLAQFKNVLVVLLLVATVISFFLWLLRRGEDGPDGLPYEAIAIFAIVVLNAVMGYVQESRAASAIEALRAISADKARVIRSGKQQLVPADELVPGDILLIEEGDAIAADARIIHSTSLQVAEAALTGESIPVEKNPKPLESGATADATAEPGLGDRTNMIFSGTVATYGRGRAVVTATGMHTELGRIARMLEHIPSETTPLQIELNRVGKMLGLTVISIAVVMIVTIILVENVRGFTALFDVLILGVALAVAAVPEGLPAVVTAVLALGVQRMARRNAIVRHLAAVETLGSATVIASDKTGTLTKNEMTVREVVTASGRTVFEGTGYAPEGEIRLENNSDATEAALREELNRALTVADQANNATLVEEGTQPRRWSVRGDPTEGALLVAARKAGLIDEALDARFVRIGEVPFSSERKLMSTIHADADRRKRVVAFSKGAPDVLVARCTHEFIGGLSASDKPHAAPLTAERRAEIMRINDELAGRAMRTLAVAYRTLPPESSNGEHFDESVEHDLVFLGLIGMIDPPREEAQQAVMQARRAGIRPIMITGDHPKTAVVIARELNIAGDDAAEPRAVTGAELQKMTGAELEQTVAEVSVYARVNPEHKLRIVKALQRQGTGEVVAMTGDGVNDAPALNTADIGIAMGITGTDVSKQAADVVLTDDNFATIVHAVEEGRGIFDNIRKFLRYLLSCNIGEVMAMFLGVVLAPVIGLEAEGETIVLPLLATQILWINLMTDGAPALALGVDPAADDLMRQKPRPRGEGVLTLHMWGGIFFVGAIMALGTLFILDAAMPGGLIAGTGSIRYAQTMAFTTLTMFQLFNVFNSRSDVRSAFHGMFRNRWLWAAIGVALLLHVAVIYVPFLQNAFSTVSLTWRDWLMCAVVASSVLWLRELSKLALRWKQARS